jgi:adenine deaminase
MPAITANLVNIFDRRIHKAEVVFDTKILSIRLLGEADPSLPYLMPGFVDAHVHVESSMLIPSEFARLAVTHGTVATVSDPHEIANVCGMEGVRFMIRNGKTVPFKFYFGAPSCVPATVFETAGAELNSRDVQTLLEDPDIHYLSEMMNFPGAINGDPEVIRKIEAAHALGKPVDGHAPGLRGETARQYINLGISTDHECFTLEEAEEKRSLGMKIIIREGSAARNFDALIPLLHTYPDSIMFGSDDKHPDELAVSHINALCARAVAFGINVFHVLQAACINPVKHYQLNTGLLQPGDPADFILVEDLQLFQVLHTYIDGQHVAENGQTRIPSVSIENDRPNRFINTRTELSDYVITKLNKEYPYPVIEAQDGQLITLKSSLQPAVHEHSFISDIEKDVLKIVVVNRYRSAPIAKAFIKNFGLKKGAIASSVAHDSHNIVAVGVDDESLMLAVNSIMEAQGGISIWNESEQRVLPLPIAGLMSADDGYRVGEQYALLDAAAKRAGATLRSPFMTLSFMALLVIPYVKLSDKGLFDGERFSFFEPASPTR